MDWNFLLATCWNIQFIIISIKIIFIILSNFHWFPLAIFQKMHTLTNSFETFSKCLETFIFSLYFIFKKLCFFNSFKQKMFWKNLFFSITRPTNLRVTSAETTESSFPFRNHKILYVRRMNARYLSHLRTIQKTNSGPDFKDLKDSEDSQIRRTDHEQ